MEKRGLGLNSARRKERETEGDDTDLPVDGARTHAVRILQWVGRSVRWGREGEGLCPDAAHFPLPPRVLPSIPDSRSAELGLGRPVWRREIARGL